MRRPRWSWTAWARAGWAASLLLRAATGAADDAVANAAGTPVPSSRLAVESQGPNTRARTAQSGRAPQTITSRSMQTPYCTQPDPRQDACYLNFSFATATGTIAPLINVSVNGKLVLRLQSFFQTSISMDHTFPGLGYRVACGPPVNDPYDPSPTPRQVGNQYSLKVDYSEFGASQGFDQASVSCPPFDAAQAAPVISVSPGSLASTQAPGSTASATLTISNDAAFPLWWNLPVSPSTGCGSAGVPWLMVGTPAGSTNALSSESVGVTFNSTGLVPGHYAAHVCVQSGDTFSPQIDVPVALTVSCPPGPPLAISAPATVGAGSPGRVASVRPNAGSTFAWTITHGTITAGQGTNAVTFTAGVAGTPVGLGVTETNPDPAVCIGSPGSVSIPVLSPGASLAFFPVTPCRLADTRLAAGPLGGPAFSAGETRVLKATGSCGVPSGAFGISMNVTVTQPAAPGHLTVYPGTATLPGTSSLGFSAGQTRANNAVMGLATDGSGTFRVFNGSAGTVHVIVDVNGYFF